MLIEVHIVIPPVVAAGPMPAQRRSSPVSIMSRFVIFSISHWFNNEIFVNDCILAKSVICK